MTIIARPVRSGHGKALTFDHNSFDEQPKLQEREGDAPVGASDLETGYTLLEPHELDPKPNELPPPLNDELEAALHARLRSFDVIQLGHDGTPVVPDWRSDVLTTEAAIGERWTDTPRSKVGGVTEGIVVVALTGAEGAKQYAAIASITNTAAIESRLLNSTVCFFRLPAGVRSIEGTLLPGMDVLSDEHIELPSGGLNDGCWWKNRYRIADAPAWLITQLAALRAAQTEGNDDMGAGTTVIDMIRKGQLTGAKPIEADQIETIAAEQPAEHSDKEKDKKDTSAIVQQKATAEIIPIRPKVKETTTESPRYSEAFDWICSEAPDATEPTGRETLPRITAYLREQFKLPLSEAIELAKIWQHGECEEELPANDIEQIVRQVYSGLVAVPPSNIDPATAFLEGFDPTGRHDLAAINPESGEIDCATFLPKDRKKMRAWIEARQGKKNLYVSVNRACDDAPHNERLSQKDIGYIRAIPADIDVPKIKDCDPSGQHFQDLRAKLLKEVAPKLAQLECPPSLVVDSGGGIQVYWRLRPAIPATPENIELVKGIGRTINKQLKSEFSDFNFDPVADPPRLLRLPGTTNIPDAGKRAQGRSPTPATILVEHSTPADYTTEQLTDWAPPTSAPQSSSSEKGLPEIDMSLVKSAGNYEELPADLRTRFESACERVPSLRNLWNGHQAPWQKDISRSGYLLAFAWGLKRDGGFTPTEFGQLLWVWEHGYADEPDKIDRRTIGRAWVGAKPPTETASGFEVVEIKLRDQRQRPEAFGKQGRPKLFYLTLGQCRAKIIEARPKHLIEGVIPARSMVVTYGESGEGKSFHVMDRWMHVAGGKPWCDRKVEQGAAVWVAAEMSEDLYDRIEAAKQHLGLSDETPFFAVPCPVVLLRPDGDTTALIELIKSIERNHSVKVVGVVIDTLSRAMAGGNENAPDDMGTLVKHLDAIRYACDCTAEVIHHTGKDAAKGARGHSSLRAATDTEIEIGGGRIKITKQRTMAGGDAWSFRLVSRRVGMRHDGSEAESCYVETREGNRGKEDWRLELSDEQKGWLAALMEKAPKSKEGFPAETAMAIWELLKRTTATTRLGTLHGAGYLTKPKGEKGGMYALADSNSSPNRQFGRQKNRGKNDAAVSAPSVAEGNAHENNQSEELMVGGRQ